MKFVFLLMLFCLPGLTVGESYEIQLTPFYEGLDYTRTVIQNIIVLFDEIHENAVYYNINPIVVVVGLCIQIFWSLLWMRTIVGGGSSSAAWGFYFMVSFFILGAVAFYVFGAYFYTQYSLGAYDYLFEYMPSLDMYF